MELWLVRHAEAAARGPAGAADRQRPLTEAGRTQAERLARLLGRLDLRLERLFTSPLTRAVQTAQALAGLLVPGRGLEELDALADAVPGAVLDGLRGRMVEDDDPVLCVGHAPRLAELAATLMGAPPGGASVHVGKGTALALEGELRAGGMSLRALLPARLVAALDENR